MKIKKAVAKWVLRKLERKRDAKRKIRALLQGWRVRKALRTPAAKEQIAHLKSLSSCKEEGIDTMMPTSRNAVVGRLLSAIGDGAIREKKTMFKAWIKAGEELASKPQDGKRIREGSSLMIASSSIAKSAGGILEKALNLEREGGRKGIVRESKNSGRGGGTKASKRLAERSESRGGNEHLRGERGVVGRFKGSSVKEVRSKLKAGGQRSDSRFREEEKVAKYVLDHVKSVTSSSFNSPLSPSSCAPKKVKRSVIKGNVL